MRKRAVLLVAALAVVGAPARAQSLFNSAGMGLPIEALDGRARALGNLGIGLRGASFMPTDPAALGRYVFPTGVITGQPSWVEFSQDAGATGSFQGNRFPLLGLSYPFFSGMTSVQVGSFLDQHYAAEIAGSVDLQGTTFPSTDRFEQDGSVSNLNLGYARMLGERHSVGVTFGRYAGSVVRTLTRSVDDTSVGIEDYVERGKWSYRGYSITIGASSDVTDIVRVAASVQLPGTLEAKASDETDGEGGSYDLPVQARLGASAQLAPGLVVTTSVVMADWSTIEADLREAARVGKANGFGVGVELSRARLFGKEAPLRFGYRATGLPFSFAGGEASERVFAGGLGLALGPADAVVVADADFALERGRRSGGGVTENFWRLTMSLVVSGS